MPIGEILKRNLAKKAKTFQALHQQHVNNLERFQLNKREKEYQQDQEILERLTRRD
ncbi:hypothetical protein [Aquibacillus rhizosphaerae]|uniref:Fur-regulated basic protein B n=1 Tax=Aquibacillus rhizosphaerae TaxID=3051431 RepID=A0ABT7L561_9BACI|nr:hypothetical protein [Aquibacillus sp. LR5S19]MDL4840335.1 hypothetical protein [Aquibacillus sp. LR5S19]